MKNRLCAAAGLVAMMCSASAEAAKEPLRLKPTSKWNVDYGDERCRLARQFGEGEDRIFLVFDKYGPGELFRLTLAGQPTQIFADQGEAIVQFGPTEASQQQFFFSGNLGTEKALVFGGSMRIAPPTATELAAVKKKKFDDWIEFTPIDSARLAAVRYLEIGKPLRRTAILETGSLRAPFAALDKCIDNLVTLWGVDTEKHRSLTRKATPSENPGQWVTTSDYPMNMLQVGQPALVEFRLNLDVDGKPTACRIQSTTRPKAFDDAVCKSLMRRAEFLPALDADGKPIASYWRSSVRFQIPR